MSGVVKEAWAGNGKTMGYYQLNHSNTKQVLTLTVANGEQIVTWKRGGLMPGIMEQSMSW